MAITNIFGRDFYQGLDADMATCVPRVDGALFWATDTLKLYCYSGAAWNEVGAGAGGSVATDTIWDAKGDLAVGTGADTASKLTVGADGEMLYADSGEATGLRWDTAPAGDVATDAIWDAKGDIAAGTGANTASKLTVGADGKYLKADSGEATGLAWDTPSGDVSTDAIWDAKGDLAVGTGANTASKLTVGGDDTYLIADSGEVTGAKWSALLDHDHSGDAGDGGTFDAANLTAGASTDGQVLTSDGAGGAAWEDAAAGTDVATDAIWDAKGDLAVGTGANTASKLTVGADGKMLYADSGEATGLKWDDPPAGTDVATDAIWDAAGDLAVGTGANTAAKLSIGTAGQVLAVNSGATAPEWVNGGGKLINRTLVGSGGVSSYDVSSIPATYDVIKIFISGKTEEAATGSGIYAAFNNDTTDANYYTSRINAIDGSISSSDSEERLIGHISGNTGTISQCEITIINYANTTFEKITTSTSVNRIDSDTIQIVIRTLEWESTSAINRITLTTTAGVDFAEGTLFIMVGYKW